MAEVTPEILAISRAVCEQGGEAEQLLQAKCKWEQMSRTAVIREWGDPRNWKSTSQVVSRGGQ